MAMTLCTIAVGSTACAGGRHFDVTVTVPALGGKSVTVHGVEPIRADEAEECGRLLIGLLIRVLGETAHQAVKDGLDACIVEVRKP
jgi:hypothetical protein